MALKLNPLLVNTDAVKAGRLPVFQRQASTSRGSHFEKTPTPWEVGYESLHTTIFFESVNYINVNVITRDGNVFEHVINTE